MVHVPAQQASALTTKVLATATRSARRPGLELTLRPFEPSSHRMAATEKPRTPAVAGSGRSGTVAHCRGHRAGGEGERPGWVGVRRRGDGPACSPTADASVRGRVGHGRSGSFSPAGLAPATFFFMPPDTVTASRGAGRETIAESIVAALRRASGIASVRTRHEPPLGTRAPPFALIDALAPARDRGGAKTRTIWSPPPRRRRRSQVSKVIR
jgi:hypothetical protein